MSRYFRNSPRDGDQGWKRLQRYSGDLSPFYLRHDSFIKVTSEETSTSPGRNFTITRRAHSQDVNRPEDKTPDTVVEQDLRSKLRKVSAKDDSTKPDSTKADSSKKREGTTGEINITDSV